MNEYFNNSTPLTKNTLARAASVNAILTNIATGFDLLPTTLQFYQDRIGFCIDSGVANTYKITSLYPPAAYVEGMKYNFKALVTNTGSSTLNVFDSQTVPVLLGAKSIKRADGTNLAAGDIVAGNIVTCVYDGTNFQLISPNASDVVQTAASAAAAAVSAAAALVSENAAAADVVLTNADVVSTNADVVTTNADAATTTQDAIDTAADVVSTNADVVSTGNDAIATAADRVQTGLDAAATAADVVSTNADVVSTGNDVTAAAASASAASTSETNASTSETNAAASYDSFDDRYLGSKAAAPTLDNDGDPLLTGAIYWNNTNDTMYVYDGALWGVWGTTTGITDNATAPVLILNDSGANTPLGQTTAQPADVTDLNAESIATTGLIEQSLGTDKTIRNSKQATSVAVSGTMDIDTGSTGSENFGGTITILTQKATTTGNYTNRVYEYSGRGVTATFTQVHSQTGGGSRVPTLSMASSGVIRMTNNNADAVAFSVTLTNTKGLA